MKSRRVDRLLKMDAGRVHPVLDTRVLARRTPSTLLKSTLIDVIRLVLGGKLLCGESQIDFLVVKCRKKKNCCG